VQEVTGFQSKREAAAEKLQEPVNLLEARRIADEYGTPYSQVDSGNLYFALRKCLEHIDAQPAQEPVAWMCSAFDGEPCEQTNHDECGNPIPLYTAPPQRPWVGLTDEDFSAINQSCLTKLQAATSAESILKEKNS
jgi:hypothetical protein